MAKRLIFSDLHFGDPDCSLRKESVKNGLRNYLRNNIKRVDEIILAGDILDANISSLTIAIEGNKDYKGQKSSEQIGFRHWLDHLFEGHEFEAGRIVYIPGNHDYIIWSILATDRVFVQPMSRGDNMPEGLPVMEGEFHQPFIRGVAPEFLREHFAVVYPDYEFKLADSTVNVTHGHYLDEQQTFLHRLDSMENKKGDAKEEAKRKFFSETARYQAVANAVSFTKDLREFVDMVHKFSKIFGKGFVDLVDKFPKIFFNKVGDLRNSEIDAKLLNSIEMYLHYYREKEPDIFIFGHTHKPGHTNTSAFGKTIEVWNDGCFVEDKTKNWAGSFILTDDSESNKTIRLFEVDLGGEVDETSA